MTNPTLLIDGDLLLYRATSVVEKEVRWDADNHVLFSNAQEAYEAFEAALNALIDKLPHSGIQIAFTKGQSFRSNIYPLYKAPRVGTRKPLCFARVREMVEEKYLTYSHPGLEADDVMGIWATKDLNTIIVSEDKDMKTIPCRLYRQNELIEVTEAEADYNFMFQTLTGDTTDGYPGCPGIGPKKAEAILLAEGDEPVWQRVVKTYEKAGLSEEDALIQARMARILRSCDWDAETKEVKLWQPPTV
jgi:DNA polymerase-1